MFNRLIHFVHQYWIRFGQFEVEPQLSLHIKNSSVENYIVLQMLYLEKVPKTLYFHRIN